MASSNFIENILRWRMSEYRQFYDLDGDGGGGSGIVYKYYWSIEMRTILLYTEI